jgi:hypothetical protein
MVRQLGLVDLDERYRKLSEVRDPLTRLKELIDFEVFRPALSSALNRSDSSKGGRPPFDAVLMFNVLILQTLYTLRCSSSGRDAEPGVSARLVFLQTAQHVRSPPAAARSVFVPFRCTRHHRSRALLSFAGDVLISCFSRSGFALKKSLYCSSHGLVLVHLKSRCPLAEIHRVTCSEDQNSSRVLSSLTVMCGRLSGCMAFRPMAAVAAQNPAAATIFPLAVSANSSRSKIATAFGSSVLLRPRTVSGHRFGRRLCGRHGQPSQAGQTSQ